MRLATLLLAAVALKLGDAALVDFDDQTWKERPVTKVIGLLQDMHEQLEKEAENDEAIYDKVACWCTSNDKGKTKAIEIANGRITDLNADIEEASAKLAQLANTLEALNKEVAQKSEALEQATAIREKETSEFEKRDKDMSASVSSLGGAVTTLGAAHGGAALSQASMMQLQKIVSDNYVMHKELFGDFSKEQHHVMTSLLQQPVKVESYAPQSGAIFGILQGMKETFEQNLKSSQTDEKQASTEFSGLKSAKSRELNAAKEQIEANTIDHADSKLKLANAQNDLEDTENALESDSIFLADLKKRCASIDHQWEERRKVRADEIQAVSDTISILSGDEAHESFSKTLGFFQVVSKTISDSERHLRQKAASLLSAAEKRSGSVGLSVLAYAAKNDAFDAVKDNIDKMIKTLKKTQDEEVKQRDLCTKEFNQNELQTAEKTSLKSDLEQKVEDLKQTLSNTQQEVEQLQTEISETQIQMKRAGDNRGAENTEFQMTVADQHATQQILKKALDRLAQFYREKSLLQLKQRQEPGAKVEAMPAGFGEYKKAGGGQGALGLLEQIIKESEMVVKEAMLEEQETQSDYESFMKDSNKLVDAHNASITDKSEIIAQTDTDLIRTSADLETAQADLISLADVARILHSECDYLLQNYDVRQSSRADEIDALNAAKAIFSGARM